MRKEEKGITLIALVVTIVVLLILAGVSISMLGGENGIITQAQNAKNKTEEAEKNEQKDLEEQNTAIDNIINGVKPGERVAITIKDNYSDGKNKATVPKGFTVSGIESEQKIADGLVIYDIPDGVIPNWTEDINSDGVPDIQTKYNQFVWIPVKNEEDYQRNLTYPAFLESQYETAVPENVLFTDIGYLPEEIQPETDDAESNEVAERTNILKYNGFYIARYEAGKKDETTLVSEQNVIVWTNIDQTDLKSIAKTMYNNDDVKSALCSGIQWDMVMKFVDGKKDGSGDNIFNVRVTNSNRHTGNPENTGKNINDKVQNIYDLEGNYLEFVAETNNTSTTSTCIYRGGYYSGNSSYRTCCRFRTSNQANILLTFRPVLYIM